MLPPLLTIFLLGFSSGLPRALTAATLTLWLTDAGTSMAAIGLFASIGLPYSLKFLWSPLVDRLKLPWLTATLGRRRGWMLATQIALMLALLGMSLSDPALSVFHTALWALLVAALSATQDIVIDAYRVERLAVGQQAKGAAMAIFGYRVGMLASSAGALYLAEFFGWAAAYQVMAGLIAVGIFACILGGEPVIDTPEPVAHPTDTKLTAFFREAVIAPFADFMKRPGWLLILLFVLLYKFGDAFLGIMTGPFLRQLGFSKIDIANIAKLFGFVATITGSFTGAWMAGRFGLMRCLWIGGILNGVSNLAFLWLAHTGPDLAVFAAVNSVENFTGAISGTVLVAYLSALCNRHYTATQYALLSSLSAVGITVFSASAGMTQELLGWPAFFLFSAVLALPGLFFLALVQRHTRRIEQA